MTPETTSTVLLQPQPRLEVLERPLPLEIYHGNDTTNDSQAVADCIQWLSFHRFWGQLASQVLTAIAQSFYCFQVEPQTLIYQEGQTPIGVYLIKWGTVEIFRSSPIGKSLIRYRNSGDLFGYTLIANAVEGVYQTSAIALTACEIWFLPQAAFQTLMVEYPAIQQVIQALLAQDLNQYAARIAWEQVRIQGLQPYIHPVPNEANILGSSKAAQKLAEQIHQASTSLAPVIFQAQTGTGKTFLAGLIHARSGLATQPFAEMDCANLPRAEEGRLNTDALFGRTGQHPGLLELMERGTLLLENVQLLSQDDRDRLIHYLKTGFVLPNHNRVDKTNLATEPPQPIQSWVRLILASPDKLEWPAVNAITIKLFTLTQRKADIPDFARYFLNQFCQEQNRSLLHLDQSDLRRLLISI